MSADLGSLYFSCVLGRMAFLAVFTTLALRQPQEMCFRYWGAAIFLAMIGMIAMAFTLVARWMTSAEGVIIYTCLVGSIVLAWAGLRLFNRKSISLRLVGGLVALPGMAYVLLLWLNAPEHVAAAAIVALSGVYCGVTAAEAIAGNPNDKLWTRFIVGATFAIYGIGLCVTFGVIIMTGAEMTQQGSAEISIIIDQAASVLIYCGFIAMAGERGTLDAQRLANSDPLTGLLNRRGVANHLGKLRDAQKTVNPGSVLLMDIDRFKAVNDVYGHRAGDAVIAAVSARLQGVLRQGDLAARWGGEEFLVILPDVDRQELAEIGERLRAALQRDPIAFNAAEIHITASIGLCHVAANDVPLDQVITRADQALYEAKRSGRNAVRFSPANENRNVGQVAAV